MSQDPCITLQGGGGVFVFFICLNITKEPTSLLILFAKNRIFFIFPCYIIMQESFCQHFSLVLKGQLLAGTVCFSWYFCKLHPKSQFKHRKREEYLYKFSNCSHFCSQKWQGSVIKINKYLAC